MDGVLNTERYVRLQASGLGGSTADYKFQFNFDPIATANLKEIVTSTNAYIVFTSTWRIGQGDNNSILWVELMKNMDELGLKERVVGTTPIISQDGRSTNRASEICQWLLDNKDKEIMNFVIVDDAWDMGKYSNTNFVRCWSYSGITREVKERAIELLLQ